MILGVGVDIVENERLGVLLKKYSEDKLKKIFTERELSIKNAHRLSGRFAAKEALGKALGTGLGKKIWFNEIEIENEFSGKPQFIINDKLETMLKQIGCQRIHLSISHEKNYSVAMVIIEGSPA